MQRLSRLLRSKAALLLLIGAATGFGTGYVIFDNPADDVEPDHVADVLADRLLTRGLGPEVRLDDIQCRPDRRDLGRLAVGRRYFDCAVTTSTGIAFWGDPVVQHWSVDMDYKGTLLGFQATGTARPAD